jgi:hypothetical protein
MWAASLLLSVLLGIGASLVCFLLITFDAVVQAPVIEFFGYTSPANQIALAVVVVWAAVAWSAVFPTPRQPSAIREIISAIVSFLIVFSLVIADLALAAGRPPLQVAGIIAASAFVLVTVVIGLRWKRWSRGFVFGQILGVLAAAGWMVIAGATDHSPLFRLQQGISNGLGDAIWWALAFAIGEKLGGARAAVIGALLCTISKNLVPTPWALLPMIGLWTTYAFIRRRSLAKHAADATAGLQAAAN